ncbi:DUF4249 domain-containing protein [Niabella beijingensis]|uniref:DUF4249 domain-containing protein n=1 Tax=Niabella beijingensis TaxID=2872700 RepID=UPI001CBC1DEB|nr:DUF4249 domain-containing protein [Niabella beijingensis]MBZ4187640.1 DUF4249 domain-containing protein [Niabella beijingensis]
MKPIKKTIAILSLLTLVLGACRKVIRLDLDDLDYQKDVIQAILSSDKDSVVVFLSKTLKIEDPNLYEGNNNAQILINRDGGIPLTLEGRGNGRYVTYIKTSPGEKYTLDVQLSTARYLASSTMPAKVNFDSLYYTKRTILGIKQYIPTVVFHDPPGVTNFYRFILTVDGFENTTIFLENDRLFDGKTVTLEILDAFQDQNASTFIDKYDSVIVNMQCIEEPVYTYLYQLREAALGNGGTTNPGNPKSNFSGGALGYFSAQTSQKKGFVPRD